MRAFTKGCLKACMIMFGIGFILIIIGFMGGAGTNRMNMENYDYDFEESYYNISNLDIEMDMGSIEIVEGDSFKIEAVNMNKDSFESYVDDNGTWFIKDTISKKFKVFGTNLNFNVWGNNKISRVKIYIPKEIVNFKASVGAGSMRADSIKVTSKAILNVGAGEININEFYGKNIEADCGMGRIYIKGNISGNNKIDCGMGEVYLELDSKEDDNNYYVDCGLGAVIINDRQYSFTTSSKVLSDKADNVFELSCGLGHIKVITK